jgi:hypothetical protein
MIPVVGQVTATGDRMAPLTLEVTIFTIIAIFTAR